MTQRDTRAEVGGLETRVERAMERLVGDDLVRAQRWTPEALQSAQADPRQIVDDFVLTWARRAHAAQHTHASVDALSLYLRREAIPRRILPAAGRAQRLSPTGLLRKVVSRPDGVSTAIKQAREPLGWGGVDDVVVLDSTLACQALYASLESSVELRAHLAQRAAATLAELELDLTHIGAHIKAQAGGDKSSEADERAHVYHEAASRARRARPLTADLIARESAWFDDSRQGASPRSLLARLERLLLSVFAEHEAIGRTVWEHLTSALLSPLLHDSRCVDAERTRDLFGDGVILTLSPPDGPGGALRAGMQRLRALGALADHSYVMPIYSDYASASLDTSPNVYLVALLRGLARPQAPQALPRAVVGLKSPISFAPINKGVVLLNDPARPEAGARAIREWRDLDAETRHLVLDGFGRTLQKQRVTRDAINAVEGWAQASPSERALVYEGYDAERRAPTPAPYAHALNAGVFLFERALLEDLACGESGSVWSPLSAYDHPDLVKGKTHEYWYTDLIEVCEARGVRVDAIHFGVKSPSGLKDTRRVARYREARAAMIRRALDALGVEVDARAEVSLSSVRPQRSVPDALRAVFAGGARLFGRVHLDASARVGEGVELDGRARPVALLGEASVAEGVRLRGVTIRDERVTADRALSGLEPAEPRELTRAFDGYTSVPLDKAAYQRLEARGVTFTAGATLTLLVPEVSALSSAPSAPSAPSALSALSDHIFSGGRVDQIRIDGAVYLSLDARVEHGTWLSGVARPLIIRGRARIGRGWRVAASTLIDVDLEPALDLDGCNYIPPRVTDTFAVWRSHLERVTLAYGERAQDTRRVGALLDLSDSRSLNARLHDPLERRARLGVPVRFALSDLDKTSARVSDGALSERTRDLIRRYLDAGGVYGVLTSRDDGTSRVRLNPTLITRDLTDEARARLLILGRFGTRALGERIARRSRGRALTLARLEAALLAVAPRIPAYHSTDETPRGLALGERARPVTDAQVALRNLDMAIYERGDLDLYVMRDVPEAEMAYAIITVYRARNRAPLGVERDQYDPRPALVDALCLAFPGAEVTASGFGTINVSWINKSDLVEHVVETRAQTPAEVAFLDDEGTIHGTGRKGLELADQGVVTVLVGEGDETLTPAVIRATQRGPDAHDRFLEIQTLKLRGAPIRVASDDELTALAKLAHRGQEQGSNDLTDEHELTRCLTALELFEHDQARYRAIVRRLYTKST